MLLEFQISLLTFVSYCCRENIVPSVSKHKKSLEKLREQDPEFYQFLQAEDQGLLSFNDSDSDESDSKEDSEEDAAPKTKSKTKKILRQLEENLDESSEDEDESDDEDGSGGRIHRLPDTLEVREGRADKPEVGREGIA